MGNKIKKIWDWVDQIMVYKTPSSEFTEEDWGIWNSYTINRVLSMNPNYICFVEYVQGMPPDKKKEIYEIYREFIPKGKTWSKYVKSSTKPLNSELINYLKIYFNCSIREVNDYYKLLTKEQLIQILTDFGLDKTEIKKQKLL